MTTISRKLQTIKALVDGNRILNQDPGITRGLRNELNAIENAASTNSKQRRLLMQVLHTTRALDTSLRVYLGKRGVLTSGKNSLGAYLHEASTHKVMTVGHLHPKRHQHFHDAVVVPRNKYLHRADSYPRDENEVMKLLCEMYACMEEVLVL